MADPLFEDAYLAGVYDRWHPRDTRDDYDFYLPLILRAEAVLDVGCGTGTLLAEAREAGHTGRLCGLDPAAGMLARARRRRDIEWVRGDLAATGWADKFDLIVMTGHAFQAVVEDEALARFMDAVRVALRPGGCFAFETRNPLARAWEGWSPAEARIVRGPDDDDVAITTRVTTPFDGRTVSFVHTFAGAHPSLPQASTSRLRFLSLADLDQLIARAGLVVEARFGDFQRNPWQETSPEIVTLAHRPD
jgi:SAM-dependent methyltransferase